MYRFFCVHPHTCPQTHKESTDTDSGLAHQTDSATVYKQRIWAATQEGGFGACYSPSKGDRGCPVNGCPYRPRDQTVAPTREVDLALERSTGLTEPTAASLPCIYDSERMQGTLSTQ